MFARVHPTGKILRALIFLAVALRLDGAVAQSPGPADEDAVIRRFFVLAQQLYDEGRYDLAFQQYTAILVLKPGNMFAREGAQQARIAEQFATQERDHSSDTRLPGDWHYPLATWEVPVRRRRPRIDPYREPRITRDDSVDTVIRKLDRIVIPSAELRGATVADAVDFLSLGAACLGPEVDSARRGINIAFKPSTDQFHIVIPALEPRITLTMDRLPLGEALRIVAKQAGMALELRSKSIVLVPDPEKP